ncbi:MAG: PEP-CTERM sorting domain-containing protein [Microcystis sp.]|jgi:hypothetical protein
MKNLSLRPNLAITVITLGCTAITCPVIAGTITFDEFPADNTNGPLPASRYSSLGVTFVATDDGSTWGGLSNGDPGNWDINGTNGPIFSGFNGDSYGLTMLFANEVSAFSLDASRSNGSQAGNSLTLKGYNNGSLVESVTVTFNDINQWSTLSLLTNVDEVRWIGNGIGFHPFGVDNIRWNGAVQTVPEPTSTLSLLVLGTLGAASTLKRKLKSSKSTEKETTKVG